MATPPSGANDGPTLLATYWTLAGPIRPMGPTEVSPWAFEDRVRVAAEAGFTGMGLSHADLQHTRGRIGYDGIARVLEAHGMRHCEFEPLYDWWTDGEPRAASDRVRAALLEAMEAIAAPSSFIKCAPDLTGAPQTKEAYAAAVAEIAEQAARAGGRMGLETLPFSDLRTPRDGLDVLAMADHPSAGLVVDIWHIERGGVPVAGVAEIPARLITHVELNDAAATPVGTLIEDTLDHRLLPGHGAFDVTGFLRALDATGYRGTYGIELLSAQHRTLSLADAAHGAADAARAAFATARAAG